MTVELTILALSAAGLAVQALRHRLLLKQIETAVAAFRAAHSAAEDRAEATRKNAQDRLDELTERGFEALQRADTCEARVNRAADTLEALAQTVAASFDGSRKNYRDLERETAEQCAVLKANVETAIDGIDAKFTDILTRHIKAEVGKWVFVGGGGGTLAAVQYCVVCSQGASKWRMVPDMGPVCEVCCETRLTE